MAFCEFVRSLQSDFKDHDLLIQALATHYHFAAMHPFLDGNGRTARAIEALLLQRAGLRDFCFIAMSNYYYDEKNKYLSALAEVREKNHDLTPFLKFGLKGIALQSKRVMKGIQLEISKALYQNMMYDLFDRLKTSRKRVIAQRQLIILKILLREGKISMPELTERTIDGYRSLRNPSKALIRDLNGLIGLKAITYARNDSDVIVFRPCLDWPIIITESEFFDKIKKMPKTKSHLSM